MFLLKKKTALNHWVQNGTQRKKSGGYRNLKFILVNINCNG